MITWSLELISRHHRSFPSNPFLLKCVSECVRVRIYVCVYVPGDQRSIFAVFLYYSPSSLFFETGYLTEAGTSLPVRPQDLSLPLFDAPPPLWLALGSHTEVSGHTQVFMCVLGISTQILTLVQQASSHPLSGLNLLLLFLFKIFFINFFSEFLTMYLGHIHPQLLPVTSPRSFLTSLPLLKKTIAHPL